MMREGNWAVLGMLTLRTLFLLIVLAIGGNGSMRVLIGIGVLILCELNVHFVNTARSIGSISRQSVGYLAKLLRAASYDGEAREAEEEGDSSTEYMQAGIQARTMVENCAMWTGMAARVSIIFGICQAIFSA